MSVVKEQIKSPKTGRWINVDGETYAKLLKTKYAAQAKSAKRVVQEVGKQKQRGPVPKPHDIILAKRNNTNIGGRGGKTRGWKDDAPKRGKEREELHQYCGSTCFLKPASNGFPICPALRATGRGAAACQADCRAIISAKVRAGQWDYKDVRKVADELGKKYGC